MKTTPHSPTPKSPFPPLGSRQVGTVRTLLLLWLLTLLATFVWEGPVSHTFTNSYGDWQLSEWMINYEGGFVRRGLTGQLLYLAYGWHAFPLQTAVEWLIIIGMAAVYAALVRLFVRERWSLTLLFAPFLITAAFSSPFWVRKDFVLLGLVWMIFRLYAACVRDAKVWRVVLLQALTAVLLLIHEAAFLFVVPLMGLHAFCTRRRASGSVGSALWAAGRMVLPACVVMALVCCHKGSAEAAREIWDSWAACRQLYPLADTGNGVGEAVRALTWETLPTFRQHWDAGWANNFAGPIPSWPVHLLNFAAIYYLTTRLNTVDLRWNKTAPPDAVKLSNVLLVQGVCLLPMFTVLSVDFGRTVPYWLITSFIAYHYLKNGLDALPRPLTLLSERLQRGLDRVRLLSNPWVYLILLFGLPYADCCSPNPLNSPVLGLLHRICELVGTHFL